MTGGEECDLTHRLKRHVQYLRDLTEDFTAEFQSLQDGDLVRMIAAQTTIAEEAQWRVEAAAAELRLRRLAKILAT